MQELATTPGKQDVRKTLASAPPRRDRKDAVLLAKVARRRRHDSPLGHNKLAPVLYRQADVFLADEVERLRAEVG